VSLDAGTGLVVLARVVEGRVERLRTLGDDCPIDANGRTVYWLQGVTPAESVRYLDTLTQQSAAGSTQQDGRLRDAALGAIARHRDPGADVIVDRYATSDQETALRRTARSLLGSTRGAHGFNTLQQLLKTERFVDNRRQLVNALGQTHQPGTAAALLAIARDDADSRVRAEAAYWLPQRGGPSATRDVMALIERDPNDEVKRRAVDGLGRLPAEESTTLLIQLAQTNSNPVIRKAAVSALSRSRDPKAVAFMEAVLK
jgi:HEAT repeat protein